MPNVLLEFYKRKHNVSIDWLLSGEGEMFKDKSSPYSVTNRAKGNSNVQAGQGITQQGNADCEHQLAAALQKIEHLEQMVQEKERLISIILSGKTGG